MSDVILFNSRPLPPPHPFSVSNFQFSCRKSLLNSRLFSGEWKQLANLLLKLAYLLLNWQIVLAFFLRLFELRWASVHPPCKRNCCFTCFYWPYFWTDGRYHEIMLHVAYLYYCEPWNRLFGTIITQVITSFSVWKVIFCPCILCNELLYHVIVKL